MKYLTKLVIADVPRAQVHELDVPGESPEDAATPAMWHWEMNWPGEPPTTEMVLYVHEYGADGSVVEPQCLTVAWRQDAFDPKALERKRQAYERGERGPAKAAE